MIDEQTFNQFRQAQDVARRNGRPLVEVLDDPRWALLLTEKRLHHIRHAILRDLYEAIEQVGVARMLSPEQTTRGSTPAEAHRVMMEFIEQYIAELP